jgi:hypothetical protein
MEDKSMEEPSGTLDLYTEGKKKQEAPHTNVVAKK